MITILTGKDNFTLITDSKNWSDAQSYCREHHTDLASVRNETENQRVQSLVPSGAYAWIGLFRDDWKWSNRSNSAYTYWADSVPDNHNKEDCAKILMKLRGRWNDFACSDQSPFFCYSGKLLWKTCHNINIKIYFLTQTHVCIRNDLP